MQKTNSGEKESIRHRLGGAHQKSPTHHDDYAVASAIKGRAACFMERTKANEATNAKDSRQLFVDGRQRPSIKRVCRIPTTTAEPLPTFINRNHFQNSVWTTPVYLL
jgi:hypothetical protein